MRRGTPAAEEFGELLRRLRLESNLSMAEMSERLGVYAATISQIELAHRALKEYRLNDWADALGVSRRYLKKAWLEVQEKYPDPIIRRANRKSVAPLTLEQKLKKLSGPHRNQVLGYIDALLVSQEKNNAK